MIRVPSYRSFHMDYCTCEYDSIGSTDQFLRGTECLLQTLQSHDFQPYFCCYYKDLYKQESFKMNLKHFVLTSRLAEKDILVAMRIKLPDLFKLHSDNGKK